MKKRFENTFYIIIFGFFSAVFYSCSKEIQITPTPNDPIKDESINHELLNSFYNTYGGKTKFSKLQIDAIETLILSQEEIQVGKYAEARKRVDNLFSNLPLSSSMWEDISKNTHCNGCTVNIGWPSAYYGLRMIKQILDLEIKQDQENLTMTAVIAPCANVRRPTLNQSSETLKLEIAPEILSNNYQVLKVSTDLFQKWFEAITGGVKINLEFYILDKCTEVNFSDDGKTIISYPNYNSMVEAVPSEISKKTDIWWVISPSGVPGDGSGFNRHFISGGMASYGPYGLPLFISDDAWFIRKPIHMGKGLYHELELKAYQPMWFQHEFMHHLFRKWPEFHLEDSSHQWFNRSTWPSDFEGKWEPDYYAESIIKRFLNSSPSLKVGLKAPKFSDFYLNDPSILIGKYQRLPILNNWHKVEIIKNGNLLFWQNEAGVKWSLKIENGELFTEKDCPYGIQKLNLKIGNNKEVISLFFNNEEYKKF